MLRQTSLILVPPVPRTGLRAPCRIESQQQFTQPGVTITSPGIANSPTRTQTIHGTCKASWVTCTMSLWTAPVDPTRRYKQYPPDLKNTTASLLVGPISGSRFHSPSHSFNIGVVALPDRARVVVTCAKHLQQVILRSILFPTGIRVRWFPWALDLS